MSKILVTESHLEDIADAIREKLGVTTTYRPGDMAAAIESISEGYPEPTGTISISQNGVVNVKDYASANVNVQPNLQNKTVTENGTVTADSGYDGLSSVNVNVQGGGGGGGRSADVNFRDYDGTIVQSYSAAEFLVLTAMPENPSHEGLTAQGWNWTLSDAKAHVTKYGKLEIGQMYITTDRKTHVYIHLEQGRTSPMLGCCPNGTVDVDWGDGTTHDTLTGTSTSTVKWTSNHNYASPGDYVIKLTVTGSMGFYGDISNNQYSQILLYTSTRDTRNYNYRHAVQKIEIGVSVTSIGNYAFYGCYGLTNITIPNNITSIGTYAFYDCYNLTNIAIPDSVTSIGNYAFYDCYNLTNIAIPDSVTSIGTYTFYGCDSLTNIAIPDSVTNIGSNAFYACYGLTNITIPDNVTSIGNGAFYACYGLTNITIPDNVTSIGNGAFYACYGLTNITIPNNVTSINNNAFANCYGVAEYHICSTTPPTLFNINAFSNIAADCIIYVPYSADHSILEAYKTANNWSTYADRMQEETA